MPTSKGELALTRLCHARLLTGADKKAPIHELVEEFVRLAAAFVAALKDAGLSGQLRRRARKVEKLTGADSPFDTARRAAEETLSKLRDDCYLPDLSDPCIRRVRPILLLDEPGEWDDVFTRDRRYPNYLPIVAQRWADRERTRWDLRAAF